MKLSWGSEQAGGAGIIAAHPTRSLEYRHKARNNATIARRNRQLTQLRKQRGRAFGGFDSRFL
jgi:hypothetical protein